jgi:hypothetical protein
MDIDHEVFRLTESLLTIIDEGKLRYEERRVSGSEGNFLMEVKPIADHAKTILDQWIVLASEWIYLEKPAYLNEKQLAATYDHIEKISIQSFYPKTSRKLFISSYQSAQYVLQSIVKYKCNSVETKEV